VRLKLDENLGRAAAELVARAGHDVAAVASPGDRAARTMRALPAEERCLVALDLDFADPFTFDPARGACVAVLRVPNL